MAVERFTSGKLETQRKLNLLVDAVRSLQNLTGDVFIRTANTPAGTTVRLNFPAILERIMKNSGVGVGDGSSGTGNPALSRWFELTDTSSNPMLGQRQTCIDGSFSDIDPSSASATPTTPIYPHPQSVIGDYTNGDIIFANFVGNCWVSVNLLSDIDNIPDILFDVCT